MRTYTIKVLNLSGLRNFQSLSHFLEQIPNENLFKLLFYLYILLTNYYFVIIYQID